METVFFRSGLVSRLGCPLPLHMITVAFIPSSLLYHLFWMVQPWPKARDIIQQFLCCSLRLQTKSVLGSSLLLLSVPAWKTQSTPVLFVPCPYDWAPNVVSGPGTSPADRCLGRRSKRDCIINCPDNFSLTFTSLSPLNQESGRRSFNYVLGIKLCKHAKKKMEKQSDRVFVCCLGREKGVGGKVGRIQHCPF